ncbi:MAG: lipid A export permease/ATP-binding protein MsbA [Betaproteobacteria bacterium]|nr:lipid A export permease/ATP-binding protein MsbA [Betaproteobacteria bacterium]
MTSTRLYGRLLSYAKPYWPGFALAALAMLVTAATETAFPALLKPLLDNGFAGASSFQVWWVPTAVLMIFLLRGTSTFLSVYAMNWIANSVLRDLRQAMFNKLLTLPASAFDARSSGQLISRVIAEVNGVTSAATNVVNTLVRDSLILIGLLGWLFWLNWKLTLIVMLLLPFLAGLTLAFSKRMRRVSRDALKATAEMTRSVEEAIFGNRVIKVFQGDQFESGRFKKVNAEFRGQSMRLAIAQALQTPISQLIAAIGVAVVLTIALLQSRAGEATVGDFISFVTAMLMMFGPLRHLADVNAQLQRGLASAEAVFELIDEKSERDTGSRTVDRVRGEIAFEGVSLAYPSSDRQVLQEVSVVIRPGETVALVGPSGGGKTSLINLLPRLYEPTAGCVRIDGIAVTDLSLASLRAQIALVSQDVVLFNDSIHNNIIYGASESAEADLNAAIAAADLSDFVASLPEGVETVIGDRGVRLSGGQRQRIAIARAVLKNAPILLLDEATSALDTKAEASVKAAIDRLRQGRTTLVVAHRLSTIVNADRILVIANGRLVEEGRHEALMAQAGLYASLYSKNLQDLEPSAAEPPSP